LPRPRHANIKEVNLGHPKTLHNSNPPHIDPRPRHANIKEVNLGHPKTLHNSNPPHIDMQQISDTHVSYEGKIRFKKI